MENNDARENSELNPSGEKPEGSPDKVTGASTQAPADMPFPSRAERKMHTKTERSASHGLHGAHGAHGAHSAHNEPPADADDAADPTVKMVEALEKSAPPAEAAAVVEPPKDAWDEPASKAPKAPKVPEPEKSGKSGSKTKIFIIAGAVVVVVAAAIVVTLLLTNTIGNGGLAARVNGGVITTKQLDASVAKLKLQNPQVFTANSGISAAQIRSSLLDELINEQLIMQDAKDKDVAITDEQVNQQIEAIKKQYGTEKQFNAVLQQQGYTLESLKVQLKYQLAAQGIARKLVPDDAVTDKDAQSYYNEHKSNYVVEAGKKVSQIKFALGDDAKASDVLAQLKKGTDFAELAQKNSSDAASAASGGDLGWTGATMNPPLDTALQEAVNGMSKGDVSDVIKASTGLFILKVTDTRDASEQPFTAVESAIKATLLNTKRNVASQNLLNDLKKNAKITIYDKVVKDYRAQKETTTPTKQNNSSKKSSKPTTSAAK